MRHFDCGREWSHICFTEREKQEVFPEAPMDGFTAVRENICATKPLDVCDAFHLGLASFTLLHSGCDANFKNPWRSGSCSISLGITAVSVTWCVLLLTD